MKMILQPAVIWLLSIFSPFSCEKKSNLISISPQNQTQQMELLTKGKWYKTAEGLDTNRTVLLILPVTVSVKLANRMIWPCF